MFRKYARLIFVATVAVGATAYANTIWKAGDAAHAERVVPESPTKPPKAGRRHRIVENSGQQQNTLTPLWCYRAASIAFGGSGWLVLLRTVRQDFPSGSKRIKNAPDQSAENVLATPLLPVSRKDMWTIGNAFEGTLILGATGSGKSSGSGRTIALSMLRAGFGGLVLTAKADERQAWESYCRETGRERDLLVFGPNEPWRFNFLDYELNRATAGAGHTENIVNLLTTILEVAGRSAGQGSGREDESYWKRAVLQLCRNSVDLLILAKGEISVPDLYKLVISAPTTIQQITSPQWRAGSFCCLCLEAADKAPKTPREQRDLEIVADYFCLELPNLSDKTRSVIFSTFTSMCDVLNRGMLRELFSGESNLTPQAAEMGKVILIDLAIKDFGDVGLFAQIVWKHAFQKAIEQRDIKKSPRSVFLWSDESQYFLTSYDMQFQTTCRAARVATVLLSQNVSNFYAALGGNDKGRAEADSLFANLNTKIFHANGDPVTNQWASTLIGRTRQFFISGSNSYQPGDWIDVVSGWSTGPQRTGGMNEQYEFEIQPSVFTKLRTGGAAHGGHVDALVFQNGRVFKETGRTWTPVVFQQQA